MNKGIEVVTTEGKTVEGIYTTNFEFVNCNYGFIANGTGAVHAVEFSNGHFDCNAACVTAPCGGTAFSISNCYIQKGHRAKGGTLDSYMINLNGVSSSRIFGNFMLDDATNAGLEAVGGAIIALNNTSTIVSNNVVQGFNAGIVFDASALQASNVLNDMRDVLIPYAYTHGIHKLLFIQDFALH